MTEEAHKVKIVWKSKGKIKKENIIAKRIKSM